MMCAVGKEHEDSLLNRVDPQAGSGKATMSKALRRHLCPGTRTLSRSKLKSERAIFIHAFSKVGSKKLARFGLQELCVVRQKLLSDRADFFGRREQSGVPGRSPHEVSIPIMYLAPDNVRAEEALNPAFRRL